MSDGVPQPCSSFTERRQIASGVRKWQALPLPLREQGVEDGEISRQAGLFMHAVQMELQLTYAEEELNASA